jgi:hypothetical protein
MTRRGSLRQRAFRAAFVVCGAIGARAAVAAFTATTVATEGCATHQCDASSYDYFAGFALDDNTYVTTDLNGPWIPFNGNATIRVWFPPFFVNRTPTYVMEQVTNSSDGVANEQKGDEPFIGGTNWTLGSGQLGYFNFLDTFGKRIDDAGNPVLDDAGNWVTIDGGDAGTPVGGGFSVLNATCVNYFVRFVVGFVPLDAAASGSTMSPIGDASADQGTAAESGADAEAGAEDGSAEATPEDAGAD